MSLKPQTIMVIENNIAIKWEDQSESYLSNKELRDKCPCANCSGESDVFGNVYRAEVAPETPKKYIVNGYINIGHYAIRIMWGDGHNAGIYSFDFLKKLNDTK